VGARAPAPVLALPNQRWSLDFVHDQRATGRRFRWLNIVDDVTRECLRAVVDTSRDCQDFRVWAGIMGKKESHYVSTQRTCDPV
jgi:hypothetical protein